MQDFIPIHNVLYKSIILLVSIVSVISIRGSLSMEVMDTLSHFIGAARQDDRLTRMIGSNISCHDFKFCEKLNKIVEEYVIVLTKVIESILTNSFGTNYRPNIYETQLKYCLQGVNEITVTASVNDDEKIDIFAWIDTFKKISAKFLELGKVFVYKGKRSETKEELELKHELVFATILSEAKFINRLCVLHNICKTTYEVTKSLNVLLRKLIIMSEEKNKEFVKEIFKVLYETSFYSQLSDALCNRMQEMFNEMDFANQMPLKDILKAVSNIVVKRWNVLETKHLSMMHTDEYLLHIMLSDMDHIYSKYSFNPFNDFMDSFNTWAKKNVTLDVQMRQIVTDIAKELSSASEEILYKLKIELEAFLELTLGFR